MSSRTGQDKLPIALLAVLVVLGALAVYVTGVPVETEILIGCVLFLAGLVTYVVFSRNADSDGHLVVPSHETVADGLFDCVQAIPAPTFVVDRDNKIILCNAEAESFFGVSSDVIQGLDLDFVDHGKTGYETGFEDGSGWRVRENQSVLVGGHEKGLAAKVLHCDGGEFLADDPCRLVILTPPVRDGFSETRPVSLDLTQEISLQDDTRELLRELNFDMRSRFQNALGILDAMQSDEVAQSQKGHFTRLELIYRDAMDRLDAVVSFLDIDPALVETKGTDFGLDDLLNDLSFALSQHQETDDNEILFDTDQSVAHVIKAHRELLTNLICHLVLHCVGGASGHTVLIRVRLESKENSSPVLNVEVLSKEKPEPLLTLDASLELEIARRIAAKIGAKLINGVRFNDYAGISLQLEVSSVDPASAGFVVPAHLKNLQALIVDDNEASRLVFEQLASILGWNVDVASSGEAALHMIRFKQGLRESYDVVLIDWRMPGLDGWETSKQIRESQQGDKTPIIVMISAHNRAFLSKNIEDRGRILNGFLTKPVTLTMLLDAVADATVHMYEPGEPVGASDEKAEPLLGKTILIVDDNQMHREVAKEFLTRAGGKVLIASGGFEAISKVQNHRDEIDVVLMDVQMPDLNGFDAVQHIRSLGYSDLPILMMTANSSSELHYRSMDAGAQAVVLKPFVMREIVLALTKHIGLANQGRLDRSGYNRELPIAIAEAGAALGFDLSIIDTHLSGDETRFQSSLKSFVSDARRLRDKLDVAEPPLWADIAREAHALGGTMTILGIKDEARLFMQQVRRLQSTLGDRDTSFSFDDPEIADIKSELKQLISSTITASERLLTLAGKTPEKT